MLARGRKTAPNDSLDTLTLYQSDELKSRLSSEDDEMVHQSSSRRSNRGACMATSLNHWFRVEGGWRYEW